MTIWFVSRHPGALEWMQRKGMSFDQHLAHLDTQRVRAGDTVIGSLPVNLAAEVCARGGRYFNLSIRLEASDRGRELTAKQLQDYEATLEEFVVRKTS